MDALLDQFPPELRFKGVPEGLFPVNIVQRLTLWARLPLFVKEPQAMTLKDELLEILLTELSAIKVRKNNPNKKLVNNDTYKKLLGLVAFVNTFERELAHAGSPDLLKVIGVLSEMFEEMLEHIEGTKLSGTCFNELILGILAQLNAALTDHIQRQTQVKRQELLDDRKDPTLDLDASSIESLKQGLTYNEYAIQYYEILINKNVESNKYQKQRQAQLDHLFTSRISIYSKLGYLELARKNIEKLLPKLERQKSIYPSQIEAINDFILLTKGHALNLSNHDLVFECQQLLLSWSKRLLRYLTQKQIITLPDGGFKSEQIKDVIQFVQTIIEYSSYKKVLIDLLKVEGTGLARKVKGDDLVFTFNQSITNKRMGNIRKQIRNLFQDKINFNLTREKLVIKNIFDLRYKHLSRYLLDNIPEFEKLIEEIFIAQETEKQIGVKVKDQTSQKPAKSTDVKELTKQVESLSIDELNNPATLNTHSSQLDHYLPEPNLKKEILNQQPKPKLKTRPNDSLNSTEKKPKPQVKSKELTAARLGLDEKAYRDVQFHKLEGCTGVIVGFEREFGAKGAGPEHTIIDEFRKKICDFPKRVGPKNENGFKWLTPSSHNCAVLMGKIKTLPWRLMPKEELWSQGKRICIYGDLINTKKGKKGNRYQT